MTEFTITYFGANRAMSKTTIIGTDADTVTDQFQEDNPDAVIMAVSSRSTL